MNAMSRRIFVAALPLIVVGLASAVHAQGNSPVSAGATLFQNVRIFNGKGGSLSAPSSVLVKGNVIERISTAPIVAERRSRSTPLTMLVACMMNSLTKK